MRRIAVSSLFLLLLLCACFWALRFAYADFLFRSGTLQNIRRAAEIVPFHPEYQARAGNLRRAVELNPYFTSAWLDLALEAESRGDLREAERCLLSAARADRTFELRWALANHYFRTGNRTEFWRWLRLSAERSYGDRTALYRLALRMSRDFHEIQSNAVPTDVTNLSAWITFLLSTGEWDAVPHATAALVPIATPGELAIVLKSCDELLRVRHTGASLSIWNGLIKRKLLPYTPLDAFSGASLTNGDLSSQPLNKCFDWRLLWRAGVHNTWVAKSRQLRIALDGKQLEFTDLLEQFVPVAENREYTLRSHYRAEEFRGVTGVRWRVLDATSQQPLERESPYLTSKQWQRAEARFKSLSALVRIQLVYERQPGTTRSEGTIVLEGPVDLIPTR